MKVKHFDHYLSTILEAMFPKCRKMGLKKEGIIHIKLKLKRVAKSMFQQAQNTRRSRSRKIIYFSYVISAVAEEMLMGVN